MDNFSEIPIKALSTATKFLISLYLNQIKVIPNENKYPRDWRGLADLFDLGSEILSDLANKPNPTVALLNHPSVQECTIQKLQTVLEEIGRWDIIEDIKSKITKDATMYNKRMNKKSKEIIETEPDQVLTYGDQHRLSEGLKFEDYDAFFLYDNDDREKAMEVIENMEGKYQLNLCDKYRDVINCDISNVITLIAERCNRLIVLISPSFLQNFENMLLMNFAATLGVERQMRKIVPCAFQQVYGLPPLLKYSYILIHDRLGLDFYKRLAASVIFIKGSKEERSPGLNEKILNLIANEENSIEQLNDVNEYSQNGKELKLESSKGDNTRSSQLKKSMRQLVKFISPMNLKRRFPRP